MQTFEMKRVVAAPRDRVWEVVSDVAGLAAHAPNLSASAVVDGQGEGMVRRCYNNAGDGWSETCTLWDPGHRYTMEVDTSDYPYPLRAMRGTWAIGDDPRGTRIRVRYDYEPKYGVAGRLLGAVMHPVFARTCRKMLDSYEVALGLRASVRPGGNRRLRTALRANAAFSAASGAVALIDASWLASKFAVDPLVLRAIGGGLVLFALTLLALAARPDAGAREVRVIVALDVAWVLGTIAVLVLFSDAMTAAGVALLAATGAVVAALAAFQALSARKAGLAEA